jgi:hypothetical protein
LLFSTEGRLKTNVDPFPSVLLSPHIVPPLVSETKYGKTRTAQIKTSVFATSNDIKKMSAPLQSRFFIVELEPYTYEEFCGITEELLSHHKVEGRMANVG